MKTKILKSLSAVLLVSLCISALLITSYAAGKKPDSAQADAKMEIVANNVSYSDSLYILYAISNEGFDRTEHEIKMLFWDKPQEIYSLGTEKYSVTDSGTAKVKGKDCLIFYSNGIAAKEMTDDVFARACVVIDGREYYTDVMKFSVLEYVYAMKEQGNIGNGQIKLFTSMLNYGTDAQNSFGHNTSRPANGTYYKVSVNSGKLADGFDNGRYLTGEKVIITCDEPAPGMRFSHWVDEDGIIVSFDKAFEITVGRKSKEYTAVYKDISNVVAQLMLEAEIPYNGTVDDIDLPTAVTFEINGESVTLEVIWDTSDFEASKIGTQNIYAKLVDTSAYATYGIEPGSIVLEVKTLPFTYELDSSNGEYVVTGYYGDAESVTIPSTYRNIYISRIASKAFNRAMTLKEVIIPDTVKKIDNGAFFYCDNIERMTLPFIGESEGSSNSWFGWIFGAEQYDIQHGMLPLAFYSVTLKEGAIEVPEYAFYKCSQITEFNIPDTVKYISNRAFEYCTGLTEFTIPSSLVNISGSFWGCTNLKRVNTSSLDTLFNIHFNKGGTGVGPLSYGAELYCNGELVREVRIPDGVSKVYLILQGCTSIEKITIPSSVKCFGYYAFYDMKSLKEVVFENPSAITDISNGLFYKCTSLVSVDLSGFTSLKKMSGTFDGCSSLERVILPSSLTEIDGMIFRGTAIKSIVLPEGVKKIPDYCFYGCEQLESIIIPDGVVEIGSSAFDGCHSLREVKMPAALTTIGSSAFYSCDKLTVIDLPERLYEIASQAFYDCSNLSKVIIRSERLNSIGSGAFNGCTKLYEVYNLSSLSITAGGEEHGMVGYYAKVIHTSLDETSQITVDENGFIIFTSETENSIIGYVGTVTEIAIPALDNGKPTIIANKSFEGKTITKVIISDGITSIGSSAFASCNHITSVTIPNSVTSIGSSAFSGCYKLIEVINHSSLNIEVGSSENGDVASHAKEVHTGESSIVNYNDYLFYTYNGVHYLVGYIGNDTELTLPDSYNGENYEINNYAFYNCDSLTSVVIGNVVTSIGDDAFYNCDSLTSVVIGDSVTSIGSSAFYNCDSLTSVVIGNGVTSIGEYAFQSCDSLMSVTIGNSVTSIGNYALYGCDRLTSVTIPDSVTSIGYSAFCDCDGLTSVTIPDSVTSIGGLAFSYCDSLLSVIIPDGVTKIDYGAFYGCEKLTIYCESESQPEGWNSSWNHSGCPVVWGYKINE